MKELGCRDLGGDCSFVARGDSGEKVKKDLLAHAEKEHAEMMKKMSSQQRKEMMSKIDRLLKERPAGRKPVTAM